MTKGILKDIRGVHMVVKDSSSSSHNNNNKQNSFKNTKQGNTKVGKGKSKGKGKCFLCGKKD